MSKKLDATKDYPLNAKRPELVKTPTGKSVDEITMDNVLNGTIGEEDCKITATTLKYQAEIAESAGNWQIAENFRRAAELTRVPDDRILEMYNALRPNTSSRETLENIALELEKEYDAHKNSSLIREAADIYEKRGILLRD